MNEKLSLLAEETGRKLELIWDEVGVSFEERRGFMNQLSMDIAYVYNDRLKMEEECRDSLKAKILSMVERSNRFASALGHKLSLESDFEASNLNKKFEMISSKLDTVEKLFEDRLGVIQQLHEELQGLWCILGVEEERDKETKGEFSNTNEDVSDSHANRCKEMIHRAHQEKREKQTTVNQIVFEIRDYWMLMSRDFNPSDPLEVSIEEENVSLFPSTINQLKELRDSLAAQKNEREEKAKGYAVQIVDLWELLSVSEEERDQFFQSHTGFGDEDIEALRLELCRLEALKTESMKSLVLQAREQLVALWDELYLSEEERRSFTIMNFNEDYSEEALQLLEDEIKSVDNIAQERRPILKQIERREAILREKIEFDATSSDPSRLLSKKRDPGRLLREEKMRKNIEKELPRIESNLKIALERWKEENGTDFEWNGITYSKKLVDEVDFKPQKASTLRAVRVTPVASDSQTTPRKAATLRGRERSGSMTSTPSDHSFSSFTPRKLQPNSNSNAKSTIKGSTKQMNPLTPFPKNKLSAVGNSLGQNFAVQKDKSLSRSSSILENSSPRKKDLNSTLPLPQFNTPESSKSKLNSTFSLNRTAVSPLNLSPSVKKRPLGSSQNANTPQSERAQKSLKNLGICSPGADRPNVIRKLMEGNKK
eukprot:TRINITY_DN6093_c0_g1_i1.p1 TRINITY_DN6093_c0_g1~~TRINITY_DN6093_c0_g1_i1.p1  ORF type:complete len:655 (+),score=255.81 TRINITY_DN6093_c0_g1_i1:137-2101(+)